MSKTKSKTKSITSASAPRLKLLGEPHLLAGEDAAAYDQLFARIYAAVNPVDIVDEMFIADVVSLEWEVLRWRRLKTSLIRARGLEKLEEFLDQELDYDLYSEQFVDDLAEILQNNLPEAEAKDAQKLAHAYLLNEREGKDNERECEDKVEEVLASLERDLDEVRDGARANKAKQLVQEYARRESSAIKLVQELLARDNSSIDALMAAALAKDLDDIERIDRLTTIAEGRRNDSLREIERRRAVFGLTLRRSVQAVEDGEFKVIDSTPARERNGP
jgi:hypothetical protein